MHAGLILIPITAYGLLSLILALRTGNRGIAEGFVRGHIVVFAFIAVSTEILSLIDGISFPAILSTWLLFLVVCLVALLRLGINNRFSFPILRKVSPSTVLLSGTLVFVLIATFGAGILYPPNNWDSMTYHMSRVAHWISNNNVSFYPTAITRQLYQMPLAEFAILHVQVLTGCDLYANLIQWMSFLAITCFSFLLAGELGLNRKQQFLSAVIAATLPMAILQASSTQNDLVVSSFLMSFALFMLRLRDKLSSESLLFAAISLGLAVLAKGTALLYCAAVGISLAVPVLMARKHDRGRFLKATGALSLVIIFAILLNVGHFWRNYNLFGHPLSTEADNYRNQDMSTAALVSNIFRNGALHLGTPSRRINWYQQRTLQLVLGSQLNNPKTTWEGTSFRISYSRHEDLAGNLIHMLLTLVALLLLPIKWRRGHHPRTISYAIGVVCGAILYCWILKWQPWASRLHTPLFALAAPLLTITVLPNSGNVRKCISCVIILCMVLYAIPFTVANQSRSLISRDWKQKNRMELYFQNRNNLFGDYSSAINALGETDNGEVGLYVGGDDWEYPFWVFAGKAEKTKEAMNFKHVGVTNVSGTTDDDLSLPLYVIATKSLETWEYAPRYAPVYTSDHVSVFKNSEHNHAMHTDENSAALHSRR